MFILNSIILFLLLLFLFSFSKSFFWVLVNARIDLEHINM
uniref:Uncharacterized protein n=1 Tax=Rhizophora mucronata TaxID=61149 RepID=A0A2P2M441_RHIMU